MAAGVQVREEKRHLLLLVQRKVVRVRGRGMRRNCGGDGGGGGGTRKV